MWSRVVLAVGAWLLGTAAATAASIYVVNQVAFGLDRTTKQVSAATVNADLAIENSERASAPSAAATKPPSHPAVVRKRPAIDKDPQPTPQPSKSAPTGKLLPSADGSVFAACQPGGAYLIYWSPQNGYEAEKVVRGPAPTASVEFRSSSNAVVMKVSCRGGVPIAHVSAVQIDDGSHHDE